MMNSLWVRLSSILKKSLQLTKINALRFKINSSWMPGFLRHGEDPGLRLQADYNAGIQKIRTSFGQHKVLEAAEQAALKTQFELMTAVRSVPQ